MAKQGRIDDWITSAQGGDQLALAKLLTTYHPHLRAWAETHMDPVIRARKSPDDLVQDVYLDVARRIAQFENRGPGSFLKWVQAILDHKLQDTRRAAHCQARDVKREVSMAGTSSDSYWNLLDNLYAHSETPSHMARRQEALDAILVSFADLSEAHRQVLQLRYLDGLSTRDVARRLDKSEAAVVALTKRALDALRKSMNRLGEFTRGA